MVIKDKYLFLVNHFNIFVCILFSSQNGDVFHWNGASVAKSTTLENTGCIWLNSESVKNRVDTKAIMAKQSLPANSMSIYGSNVLVAGDNEAIYVIPGINL